MNIKKKLQKHLINFSPQTGLKLSSQTQPPINKS